MDCLCFCAEEQNAEKLDSEQTVEDDVVRRAPRVTFNCVVISKLP